MRRLILLAAAACGSAQQHPTATAAAAKPTLFSVTVTGHGRQIVFIPGLAASPAVWDETVRHLGDGYEEHVLWLDGMGGKPPAADLTNYTGRVVDELAAYVKTLDHPVIVGHSMGGTLALRLAEAAPDAVGPVVVVDSAPFIGGAMDPNATAASVEPDARQFRDQLATGGDAAKEQVVKMLADMVTDPTNAQAVGDAVRRSDAKTIGEAFYEMFVTDSRPGLAKIKTPVLLILADRPVADAIKKQFEPIPKHESVLIPHTKHFVMLDDPDGFDKALDAFLLETR